MQNSDGLVPRQVDFPEAIEVANWAGIRFDLEFVRDACERFLKAEESDVVIKRALFGAALVAYVRCFKKHSGVRVGLDEPDFEAMGEPNVLGLHRFLIDMRDQHVAHSVNPFESVIVGVAQVDDQPTLVSFTQFLIDLPPKTVNELKEMSEYLIGVATEKSATAESIVLYRFGGLTEDQISALPPIKAMVPDSSDVDRPRDGLKRRLLGRGGR